MKVIETRAGQALCEDRDGNTQWIDTLLVGDVACDAWVLNFLGSARELLTEEKAMQIGDALAAVNLAMQGEVQLDHLFADLVDREPQLPAFLQEQLKKDSK